MSILLPSRERYPAGPLGHGDMHNHNHNEGPVTPGEFDRNNEQLTEPSAGAYHNNGSEDGVRRPSLLPESKFDNSYGERGHGHGEFPHSAVSTDLESSDSIQSPMVAGPLSAGPLSAGPAGYPVQGFPDGLVMRTNTFPPPSGFNPGHYPHPLPLPPYGMAQTPPMGPMHPYSGQPHPMMLPPPHPQHPQHPQHASHPQDLQQPHLGQRFMGPGMHPHPHAHHPHPQMLAHPPPHYPHPSHLPPNRFVNHQLRPYPQHPLPTPSATPPPVQSPYGRKRSLTDTSVPQQQQQQQPGQGPAELGRMLSTDSAPSNGTGSSSSGHNPSNMQGQQQQQQQQQMNGPVHKLDRETKKMSLYKTELCRSWEETGTCRYGTKCQFAHSDVELRHVDRHPKYKTEMCKTFWEKGTCPYGKRCCFIHTERDSKNTVRQSNASVTAEEAAAAAAAVNGGTAGGAPITNDEEATRARARAMSTGSIYASSDVSDNGVHAQNGIRIIKDGSPSESSYAMQKMANLASSAPSTGARFFDHRAIAEAYFSGRRASNGNVPHGQGPDSPGVEHITQMMRNTHVGGGTPSSAVPVSSSGMFHEASRRRSNASDLRLESPYGTAPSSGFMAPVPEDQAPLTAPPSLSSSLQHTSSGMGLYDSLGTHQRRADRSASVSEDILLMPVSSSLGSSFYSPSRAQQNRTRRSRSVTQPTMFLPLDGTSSSSHWQKSRSESFSGYLPGLPQEYDEDYDFLGEDDDDDDDFTAALQQQYMHDPRSAQADDDDEEANAILSVSSPPYYGSVPNNLLHYSPATRSSPSSHQQQQQHTSQLLSPPPSAHPSPVRETILEEEAGFEMDDDYMGHHEGAGEAGQSGGMGPAGARRRTQSFGHRLPIFQNIKRS